MQRTRGRGRRGGRESFGPPPSLALLAPGSLDVLLRASRIWRSCSVSWCCLRIISDLDSFGRCLPSCFRILPFLGLTVDTAHASVAGAFGYYYTYFCVKEDLLQKTVALEVLDLAFVLLRLISKVQSVSRILPALCLRCRWHTCTSLRGSCHEEQVPGDVRHAVISGVRGISAVPCI